MEQGCKLRWALWGVIRATLFPSRFSVSRSYIDGKNLECSWLPASLRLRFVESSPSAVSCFVAPWRKPQRTC